LRAYFCGSCTADCTRSAFYSADYTGLTLRSPKGVTSSRLDLCTILEGDKAGEESARCKGREGPSIVPSTGAASLKQGRTQSGRGDEKKIAESIKSKTSAQLGRQEIAVPIASRKDNPSASGCDHFCSATAWCRTKITMGSVTSGGTSPITARAFAVATASAVSSVLQFPDVRWRVRLTQNRTISVRRIVS
jgi:hypothetical protein